ncbi:MAG: hypothetical protein ABEJ42_06750 [Halobacteriaceae archaeon]
MTPDGGAPTRRDVLRRVGAAGGVAGLGGATGCGAVRTLTGGPEPVDVAAVRERTAPLDRYRDVSAALADGYRTVHRYVGSTDEATLRLGTPLYRPERASTTDLDPARPAVLFYDLASDGTYHLAGVEWRVPAEAVDAAPALFGRRFHAPAADHGLGISHYGLHAWLYADNPAGTFAVSNRGLEPPPFADRLRRVRERLSQYVVGSAAVEAGYRNTEHCVALGDGHYGVPFVREGTATTGGTDPTAPPVLLYVMGSNWSYVLAGAEWWVPAGAVDAAPTLFGQRFHAPADGHVDARGDAADSDAADARSPAAAQPRHYGLHAWLFRVNPRGLFARSNPALEC